MAARHGVAVDFAVEEGGIGDGGDDGDSNAELGEEMGDVDHGDQMAMADKWKENNVELMIFSEHDDEEEEMVNEVVEELGCC